MDTKQALQVLATGLAAAETEAKLNRIVLLALLKALNDSGTMQVGAFMGELRQAELASDGAMTDAIAKLAAQLTKALALWPQPLP